MPVWEHDQCVSAFSQPIFKTNICAAAYEGGKDSCLVNHSHNYLCFIIRSLNIFILNRRLSEIIYCRII